MGPGLQSEKEIIQERNIGPTCTQRRYECGLPSAHGDAHLHSLRQEGCIWVKQIYPLTSESVISLGLAFPKATQYCTSNVKLA